MLMLRLLGQRRLFSSFSALRNVKNEAIGPPHTLIRLVSSEDSSLLPPKQLREILRTVPLGTHSLVVVKPAEDGLPAIAKILKNEMPEETRTRQKEKKKANTNLTPKEVAFTWSSDPHDVKHKMKRAREFLEQGRKVDIMISRKKGTKVTPEMMTAMVGQVEGELEGVGKKIASSQEQSTVKWTYQRLDSAKAADSQ